MKRLILAVLIIAGLTCSAQQNNDKETVVVIKTSMGTIKAKLYNDTPQHRDNFIKLANEGWYNGSPFHRVIKNFMIQSGQNANGRLDPGYTIPAEFKDNHFHKNGALAAARQGDEVNPKKASSGSQFYIVHDPAHCKHLDGNYTVFGEVTEGLDVVDKIATVETGPNNVPIKPVTIISVTVEKGCGKDCEKKGDAKTKSCCH